MELTTAFNIAMVLVAGSLGWLMRVLFDRLKKLEATDEKLTDAVNALSVELPKSYTSKADFKEMGDNIFRTLRDIQRETREGLQRIDDKLDGKADRI